MKRVVLLLVILSAGFSLVCCGGGSSKPSTATHTSGLTERVFASQSVSAAPAFPEVVIINGEYDAIAKARPIGAGSSPGLMAISPDRSVVLSFDAGTNSADIISSATESNTGSVALGGPTTSMIAVSNTTAYAAVPTITVNGSAPGAVVEFNIASGGVTYNMNVPNVQIVVANPSGTELLAFSGDSDSVTVLSPSEVDIGNPVTAVIPTCAGCRPVNAVFSPDGTTAYILNCGAECYAAGGVSASVQPLNMASLTLGAAVPVDGATVAYLNGSTLYVAGNSVTNNSCTGETTAATTCGRLDMVDINAMAVTGSIVITDGYHDRIDLSVNGQLFVGSYNCTNVGDVNDPVGEVRGCLTIFNTTNNAVIIPPDNGDVTGLQSFSSRDVEYVAEGGNLRVYDTLIDSLLLTEYIETGTIVIPGQVVDVKAVDFF
ncbi:MAG: hypothetical protein ACLQLC_16725 [Candidatus Sulfotelmatobacter sp.]